MKMAHACKPLPTLLLCASALSLNAFGHESDDPLLAHVMFDHIELQDSNDNPAQLGAQMWVGKTINKFWLKTEVEQHHDEDRNNSTYSSETQALYSRAFSPFWDFQIGALHKTTANSRNWGVIGVQGLAPYWFDIDVALFVGKSNRIAARFSAEYELLFTQHLVLTPNIEVNVYGQNDAETGTGSGLSDIKTGMRLRYEIRREFAPYIGINYSKNVGNSATYAKNNGEAISDTELVIGLRVWF